MGTPFSEKEKSFSDQCHMLARETIYPKLFGVDRVDLSFKDISLLGSVENTIPMLDAQMGVDRVVEVSINYRHPLVITIQERFRAPKYQLRQDLTITEWNCTTDLPSELYKIRSGYFVYGYSDKKPNPTMLKEAIAVNTTELIMALIRGDISLPLVDRLQKNPKNQTFVPIKFNDIQKAGIPFVRFFGLDRFSSLTLHEIHSEVRKEAKSYDEDMFEALGKSYVVSIFDHTVVLNVPYKSLRRFEKLRPRLKLENIFSRILNRRMTIEYVSYS